METITSTTSTSTSTTTSTSTIPSSREQIREREQTQEQNHILAIDSIPAIILGLTNLLTPGASSVPENIEVLNHFRIQNASKFVQYKENLVKILANWAVFQETRNLKKSSSSTLKMRELVIKTYNPALNKLQQCLEPNSCLNNLLGINAQYKLTARSEPHFRLRVDLATLELPEHGDLVLNLNHGPEATGCIFNSSWEEARRRLMSYLGDATPKDLVINVRARPSYDRRGVFVPLYSWGIGTPDMEISIRIPVNHSDPETGRPTGKSTWANTNDPSVLRIFFDGNNPGNALLSKLASHQLVSPFETVKYEHFLSFQEAVRRKISMLIGMSGTIPLSPGHDFLCIECPRITPACGYKRVIPRRLAGVATPTVPHSCNRCRMDICPLGCGQVFHGNSPCSATIDEASAAFIAETSVPCPRCAVAVFKYEGCNHMVCQCACEFCYTCGQEFALNERAQYMITEHYSDNAFAQVGVNRCRQFS